MSLLLIFICFYKTCDNHDENGENEYHRHNYCYNFFHDPIVLNLNQVYGFLSKSQAVFLNERALRFLIVFFFSTEKPNLPSLRPNV